MKKYTFLMHLLTICSIIFFILAVVFFIKDKNFLAHSVRVQAKITDIDDNKSYFEFKDRKGNLIHGSGRVSSGSPDKYKKGGTLDVFYLPDNPGNCCEDSFLHIWLGTFFCTIFAIAFLIDVVALYFLKKLKSKLFPE